MIELRSKFCQTLLSLDMELAVIGEIRRRLVDRRADIPTYSTMMPTAQVLRNDQLLLQGFSGI